jgi:two-component system, LytTR family, sensor kinase
MQKKGSIYWICQVAGWSALSATTIFFYLTLSIHKAEHVFIITLMNASLGIFFTHLMRLAILQFDYLKKPVKTQIILVIPLTLLFSFIYSSTDITFENLLHLRDDMVPRIPTVNALAFNCIRNFFIFFTWNLLYYSYHFVENNRQHEVNTLKLQALVKELELTTIKSHINPHFIFNALNSIRALVDENPQRARTAITELSNILRSSMHAEKSETVPLAKELNIVEDYLALEQMRFEERLKIEMQIEDETLFLPIPPMMLQTLVENAIKHGISKKINGGSIRIISHLNNGMHELIVQNTGQLNGHINGEGFGIKSTENRLKLLYNDKASFLLENIDTETVQSKITMPILN